MTTAAAWALRRWRACTSVAATALVALLVSPGAVATPSRPAANTPPPLGSRPPTPHPRQGARAATQALAGAARGALSLGDEQRAAVLLARLRATRDAERATGRSGELAHVEVRLLEGLLALQGGRPHEASSAFGEVLRLRPTRTAVWLYLAQARYANGRPQQALTALASGEARGRQLPAFHALKARCLRELGRSADAHAALEVGLSHFPADSGLLREKVGVLLELGLSFAARTTGEALLAQGDVPDPWAYAALAEAHTRAGDVASAVALLERARLRFAGDSAIGRRLAHAYAHAGLHGQAGRLLEGLAWKDPELAFEAADQYRLAGRFASALRCNGKVLSSAQRIPQRAAILARAGRADEALALLDGLMEGGWLDDGLRPALAAAALQAGRYALARDLLGGLGPDAGGATRELERRTHQCLAEPETCP